jgi:hypothetical protein
VSKLAQEESIGLDWTAVLALLRLMTRPLGAVPGLPLTTALDAMDFLLSQPNVTLLQPPPDHHQRVA